MNQPVVARKPKKILVLFNHIEETKAAPPVTPEVPDDPVGEFDDVPTTIHKTVEPAPAPPLPAPIVECNAVAESLRESGFEVVTANLEDDVDRVAHAVVVHRPAAIFNLVGAFYGDTTEHTYIAGLFDLYGYPYTFADPFGLIYCQERARGHLALADGDVPVPGYAVVRDVNAIPETEELRWPLIVTQAYDDTYDYEGYRSPITDRESLETRIQELAVEYDMPLLIEEFIDGPRIYASVIGNRVLEVLPLVEKMHDDESGIEEMRLAQLDIDTAGRVRQLARRAFRIMGCRDAAQVDFVQGEDGQVYVTDVRPMFDMVPGAPFRVASEHSELGFAGVVAHIAKSALSRGPADPPVPAAPAPNAEAPVAPPADTATDTAQTASPTNPEA